MRVKLKFESKITIEDQVSPTEARQQKPELAVLRQANPRRIPSPPPFGG